MVRIGSVSSTNRASTLASRSPILTFTLGLSGVAGCVPSALVGAITSSLLELIPAALAIRSLSGLFDIRFASSRARVESPLRSIVAPSTSVLPPPTSTTCEFGESMRTSEAAIPALYCRLSILGGKPSVTRNVMRITTRSAYAIPTPTE